MPTANAYTRRLVADVAAAIARTEQEIATKRQGVARLKATLRRLTAVK